MLRAGSRVLVALSGGPDSVATTLLLRELESRGELVVAGVAHLNHLVRPAAGDDEAFCRAFADELGLAIRVDREDVPALARARHTSLEAAGRRARYGFLSSAADELGADVIATGHTRDDQAETFLLRLLRGAGPRGLAGIHPVAGRVIRPLIDVRRHELLAYLDGIGRRFREDESNRDLTILRNRVRHALLPYLERDFSPGIVDVLAREASVAREDEARLQQEAIDLADLIVLSDDGPDGQPRQGRGGLEQPAGGEGRTVQVDADALTSLAPALASRVARIALTRAAPDRFIGFEHVEQLLDFARESRPGTALSLPGQEACRRGSRIVLARQPFRAFANSFRVPLSIPGEVTLGPQGWAVSAGWLEGTDWRPDSTSAAAVQASRLALPLAVRSRQPGDRFRPLGLGGRGKKLQDYLVDRKVPRETRDLLPLVVDADDRIVWIVGHGVAEDFRVTELSQGVILLKARRLGGVG